MSVTIIIRDDGHIEAMHNSGRVLWSIELDEFAYPGFSKDLANWIGDIINNYGDVE